MTHTVTFVPSSHTSSTNRISLTDVLDATGVQFSWEEQKPTGPTLSDALIDSAKRNGTVLMEFQHGDRSTHLPPMVQLRKALGCYANLRPAHSLPGIPCRMPVVDLLIVRETTEDIYAHLEHESIPGVFESLKVTTRSACERIAHEAFRLARAHNRKKVTIVHKANIMKKSDGLFLQTAKEVASQYPDIETEDCIVDALCMKIVLHPEWFDVLLCANLFGDIVSDLASGLVGGSSNCPSANISSEVGVFTSGHGDPPERLSSGFGNPVSMLCASVLMLRHLNEQEAANRLMGAIESTLASGIRPQEAGGSSNSDAILAAVRDRL